jgi:NAD(P)-dependent dehydrogenase (short-subunit alcohol dehydrogenase family)
MELREHSALVTGAGTRLGKAFAAALVERGASVAVHYRSSADGAREVVEEAGSKGVRGVALQADLADPEAASRLVDRAVDELGEIHFLVNSASIFDSQGPMKTDVSLWDRSLAVNLRAPFLLSQAFARHREGRPGAIVNMLDWRALRPGPDHFAYTIAKAGLAAMTRSLARALAPSIRVNGLALGAILPPSDGAGIPDAQLRQVPAGRIGSVEETVESLLFLLAGPEYITGEILHLDGGRQLV